MFCKVLRNSPSFKSSPLSAAKGVSTSFLTGSLLIFSAESAGRRHKPRLAVPFSGDAVTDFGKHFGNVCFRRKAAAVPNADVGSGQFPPGKAFARIGLALRRDVGVADDHGRGNPPAVDDIAAKFRQRGNLLSVETALAERAVADLDADGGRIDVGDAAPEGDAGMPGAFVFADALINGAVVINDVMSGKLQFSSCAIPSPAL